MRNGALYVAGAIFAFVCAAHVVRLVNGIEIIVDGNVLPLWISYPGAFIAGLLAIWMVTATRRA